MGQVEFGDGDSVKMGDVMPGRRVEMGGNVDGDGGGPGARHSHREIHGPFGPLDVGHDVEAVSQLARVNL